MPKRFVERFVWQYVYDLYTYLMQNTIVIKSGACEMPTVFFLI